MDTTPKLMDSAEFTDAEIEAIRNEHFPVTRQHTFLNHAAVAPLSGPARTAMRWVIDDATSHATRHYRDWVQRQRELREIAARLIGADPDEIAIVKNTTEGVNIVAAGIDWRTGDNIVVPDCEFPANVYPWLNQCRHGVEVRFVPSTHGCIDTDALLAHCDDRTRVVAISHVEYASGFRNDIQRIGAFCAERGIFCFVDAIQGLGCLPFHAHDWNVDALAADGHKWMLGPEGLGIFYCRRAALGRLRLAHVGWASVINAGDYGHYDFTLLPSAERFEIGTPNTVGIFGLAASLELLLDLGIDRIERRVLALTSRLREGLAGKGYTIFGATADAKVSGIVSFSHPERDARRPLAFLEGEGVMIAAREGRLRASPHFYNTTAEIGRLLELLPE